MKPVEDGLLGVAVGDALGVPVEFHSRQYLVEKPITGMIGYGTYNQPPGTWSDDSSLTFCLAESLCHGYDLQDMADRFNRWMMERYWTPHGQVFDIGMATSKAISAYSQLDDPTQAGGRGEYDNGNGSLMRILPLAYYLYDVDDPFPQVHQVSCLTHGHLRSQLACGIYVYLARELLAGKPRPEAYENLQSAIPEYYSTQPHQAELHHFDRILKGDISKLSMDEIQSSGYVLHTLEASLWCFLREETFSDTVLTAVNLGGDTDTTGAVAGGLAGIAYGRETIPDDWVESLARLGDILDLARRLEETLG